MTRVRFSSLFLAVLLWGAAACTQGEGELCQETDDCDDGLRCCIGASTTRGTCEAVRTCPNEEAPSAAPDASTDAMMSQPEGGAQ